MIENKTPKTIKIVNFPMFFTNGQVKKSVFFGGSSIKTTLGEKGELTVW